jgi:hypothetical protein
LTDATNVWRCWDNRLLPDRAWPDIRRFNDDISTGVIGSRVRVIEKGASLLLLAFHLGRV